MSYKCKLYSNTGFNDTNIPDSPALLGVGVEVPALDIWQDRNLSEIRVKARWDDVKDVDYISLENSDGNVWYYYTGGATMTATDVAVFPVIQDYILSIGGVANLNIIDGITERVHVSDDTFGAYTEADPLTVPTKPMIVKSQWLNEDDICSEIEDNYPPGYTYVDSILNIQLNQDGAISQLYEETSETGDTVSTVVPRAALPSDFVLESDGSAYNGGEKTYYSIGGSSVSVNTNSLLVKATNKIRDALTVLKSLGVDNPVLNQVYIPSAFISFFEMLEDTNETEEKTIPIIRRDKNYTIVSRIVFAYMATVEGTSKELNLSVSKKIPFKTAEYTADVPQISNNRVYYGEYTKYGLLTAAGESCEYNAEDLAVGLSEKDAPTVAVKADPRPTGKPYYRFASIDGDSSDTGFWRNCVAGMQWKQVPLTYTEPSGTALNTLRYENSKAVSTAEYKGREWNRTLDAVTGVTSGLVGAVTSFAELDLKGVGKGFTDAITANANSALNSYIDRKNTNAQRTNELAELAIANSATVPVVQFPYNAEVIRDFYGNGVLMYRFVYDPADAHRIDTLLTAYGYRYTKQLELSDFTNRRLFNFVKCSSISIGGRVGDAATSITRREYPKWINKGIEDQLKNGVRVWHVIPQYNNFSYIAKHNTNTIVD